VESSTHSRQQRAAVDHVNGEARFILVREVAPDRIAGLQLAQRFECERLQSPGTEGIVVVAWIFDVDLQRRAELADVLVNVGSNQQTRSLQPRSHCGASFCIVASSARASMSGAPNSSSGRVVPRPSESVVPSTITVPA
jgi:hypothetical protein